jgi:hypothetical protein
MVKEKKNNKGERHIKEKNERIREKNRRWSKPELQTCECMRNERERNEYIYIQY